MVQRSSYKLGSSQSTEDPGIPAGPFSESAPELLRAGVVPIPCEGKRPLVKGWSRLTLSDSAKRLPDLVARSGSANVGIACGASDLVVVDIDWAALLETMIRRFGPTPLVIRSPSDGFHLYYRAGATDVGCRNLRGVEGLAVDIKGRGGLVIAPPSRDLATGKCYWFHEGSWDCFADLPVFPADRLPVTKQRTGSVNRGRRRPSFRIPRGERNNSLFRELLKIAVHCADFDALLDVAHTRNDELLTEPLPASEVVATAQSAWRYELEGRNWVGRASRTVVSRNELLTFARHKDGGDALILWAHLEGLHARRREAFVVDREAMARADVLPGWSSWRYRQAIQALRGLELLVLVEGGRRRADKTLMPNRYLLRRPLAGFRQNATRTVFCKGVGPSSADFRFGTSAKQGDEE